MKESWIQIRYANKGYKISSLGRIKSGKKLLKTNLCGGGYFKVNLYLDGASKTYRVHRIVADHFLKNIEEKYCVNHINGDKTDNRAINLEWVNHKENSLHAVRACLMQKGEAHHATKIDDIQAMTIKTFRNNKKYKPGYFAEKYKMKTSSIRNIMKSLRWSHI